MACSPSLSMIVASLPCSSPVTISGLSLSITCISRDLISLATGLCDREINWQAVWDYFTYLYVPHPQTIFRDIWQLPPGCWLRFDIKTGTVRLESYWDPLDDSLRALG